MNGREKFLGAAEPDLKAALEKIFDKAAAADKSGRVFFTVFLSEREYSEFLLRKKHLGDLPFTVNGGYEAAARVMIAFGSEEEEYFPISAIRITGRGMEKLSHPDFLGSILSLGIDRSRVGDIVITDDETVVFAEEKAAMFIADSLREVGGVYVETKLTDPHEVDVSPRFEEITGTVASLRADSVLSVMLKTSRAKAAEYIEAQKFYLNQILCTECDKAIKPGDIMSVRRRGKAIVTDTDGRSKKGRIYVTLKKYL